MPMDTVRVRMMIHPKKWNKGYLHCLKGVYRNEGFLALMSGLNAALLRQSVFATVRLGCYDFFNGKITAYKGQENVNLLDRVVMGALSGTVAIILANPMDTIKTRLQADALSGEVKPRYNNLSHAFVKIWQKEGFHGLYQSLPVNIARN